VSHMPKKLISTELTAANKTSVMQVLADVPRRLAALGEAIPAEHQRDPLDETVYALARGLALHELEHIEQMHEKIRA